MSKKYVSITTEQRRLLIDLIYKQGLNIRQAAIRADIYYPTAKAINKIYRQTGRIDKIVYRCKPNNNVQAVLEAAAQAGLNSTEIPEGKLPLKKVPDCDNVWIFDGAAKRQKKAEPAEEEKVKQNEHSESAHQAIQSHMNNEALARQPAQISKEAGQSTQDEQHQ